MRGRTVHKYPPQHLRDVGPGRTSHRQGLLWVAKQNFTSTAAMEPHNTARHAPAVTDSRSGRFLSISATRRDPGTDDQCAGIRSFAGSNWGLRGTTRNCGELDHTSRRTGGRTRQRRFTGQPGAEPRISGPTTPKIVRPHRAAWHPTRKFEQYTTMDGCRRAPWTLALGRRQ